MANEIKMFGLSDVQSRIATFEKRAKSRRNLAAERRERGERLGREAIAQALEFDELGRKLAKYEKDVAKETKHLYHQSKVPLDGKRGAALDSRGLRRVCGLVYSPTKLIAIADRVEKAYMWWADEWIVDILKGFKGYLPPQQVSKFYDFMKDNKDKDTIQSRAGMLLLKYQDSYKRT